MRPRVLVLLLAGLALGATTPALAATHAKPTTVIVVDPVHADGTPVAGFTVTTERDETVFCDSDRSSLGAVSAGIQTCYPSAAYVPACWRSTGKTVLCTRDPRKQQLVRIALDGSFKHTPVVSKAKRAPLVFQLDDGAICTIRIGGAWGTLPGHPDLDGTASCTKDGETWAKADAKHGGIDESHAAWTVKTGKFGKSRLVVHHVTKAWFVGTAP